MATLQINGTVNEINEVLKVMSNHFDIQIRDEKSDQEYSVDFLNEEWENDSFVSEMLTGAYND
ncbi:MULTISPECIES: hypothetical protein [unclassified Bacillus (in: firmicutes)]|uniref:hypothetical protein n=1 Tax=unclassified Bacillus (in: firmicutes) TaxID=185979 RepID=UPI000BF0C6BB|nr:MULTISPECIES: hypothetical protein [unclassified Bacillus (in: firmicutes)]PEJ54567.1 hypothetical protein CN692_19760 [Bacillus sp. AFS002410]PEL13305.1 hypothetical protein CN601_05475 [Bacillus sp. AFS017336]